jgi:membrane associated rhomboid family serine protease
MNYLFLMGDFKLWEAPITYLLLAITVFSSYKAMEDYQMKDKMIFHPYTIKRYKEWYRFFSHGLIHADWIHLLFNAYVLYAFGAQVEMAFYVLWGKALGPIVYLAMYVSGLAMSSLYSYYKHQDNAGYRALGASGAVSSVVFSFILLSPTADMGLIFIPGIRFPAVVFGIAYLLYSAYMSKKGRDNIGHDAHYWGSVWGFVFPVVLMPPLFFHFLTQIQQLL